MYDRAKNADVFIVSTEGGVDIEEVAEKSPEKIIKAWVKEDTYPLADAINIVINALDLSSYDDAFEIFSNICNICDITTIVEISWMKQKRSFRWPDI